MYSSIYVDRVANPEQYYRRVLILNYDWTFRNIIFFQLQNYRLSGQALDDMSVFGRVKGDRGNHSIGTSGLDGGRGRECDERCCGIMVRHEGRCC